jgi:hypothetical protein
MKVAEAVNSASDWLPGAVRQILFRGSWYNLFTSAIQNNRPIRKTIIQRPHTKQPSRSSLIFGCC